MKLVCNPRFKDILRDEYQEAYLRARLRFFTEVELEAMKNAVYQS